MIDTHAHIFTEEYDNDREQVILECKAAGISRVILPAIDSQSHDRLEKTHLEYPDFCLPTIGVHPTSINENPDFQNELHKVEQLLREQRLPYVAIGEIGLDLYWSKAFLSEQTMALEVQLELARQYNLPVILHCRDAFNELFGILERHSGLKGVFHGFSGTVQDYQKAKSLGNFKFGIGGVVTFKNNALKETVRVMASNDLVLETDSPYLTPVPHRGKRNNPKFIPIIAAEIAKIKGVTTDEIIAATTANAKQLFNL